MGLQKVQKQGRDENTRKLSCCREVVVKKDWMTIVFHSFLVSVLFTGASLLVLNFYRKLFTSSVCFFLAAWQQIRKAVW